MNRIPVTPKKNEYSDLLTDVNNLFISIKVHQMPDNEKTTKVKENYKLPDNQQCDILFNRIKEVIEKFDKPAIFY